MSVAEAPAAISMTLRVAMVRGSRIGGDEDELDRRIGGAVNVQMRAIGGEGGIHGEDRFIVGDAAAAMIAILQLASARRA